MKNTSRKPLSRTASTEQGDSTSNCIYTYSVPIQNKFSLLVPESYSSQRPCTQTQFPRPEEKGKVIKERLYSNGSKNPVSHAQGHMFILSDSHGRDLGNILKKNTDMPVTNFVKPGARIGDVVSSCNTLKTQVNENDYIVIFGGQMILQLIRVTKCAQCCITHWRNYYTRM